MIQQMNLDGTVSPNARINLPIASRHYSKQMGRISGIYVPNFALQQTNLNLR
jgi:hypothetical protein